MKKSIIALMGLFTLVACSEDTYQDADKMNENSNVVTPPTVDSAIPYESPYNGGCCGLDVITYVVNNMFPDDVEIVGHFGLGYYDGADDGIHFTHNFFAGQTPTLYTNNLTEYLNIIYSAPVSFPNGTTIASESMAPVIDQGLPHFPVEDQYGGNATSDEVEVINAYGKMYFLDVKIPSIGYSTRIKVKFGDDLMDYSSLASLSSDWDLIGNNIPGIAGDLVYNLETQEICLANDRFNNGLSSEDSFVFGGRTWYVRAFTDAGSVQITITP